MNLAPPKGTRDFYPENMHLREHIFTSWEKTCRKFGFEKFDAPVFEHLELYTEKSGAEIEQQLYTFEDKGGRKLSLRPELTPSLARMVAAKGNSLKKPIKWYSIPKLFRYEKMQKGRLREFFQLNMDIVGIADISADAELIAAAAQTMRDLNFDSTDFRIHISSRTLLEQLLLFSGIQKDLLPAVYQALDKMPKMSSEDFRRLIGETVPEESAHAILTILSVKSIEDIEKITTELPALDEIKTLFDYLSHMDMDSYCTFDISIVRGLAYYTGTVFEIFDTQRSMRAIAGGGRYDKLIELYGGTPTPAVGFAAGDVVLADLLREKGSIPPPTAAAQVFLISFTKNMPQTMTVASHLRRHGISTTYPLKMNAPQKQLKKAAASGCTLALFIDGEETLENTYTLRILDTGEEVRADITRIHEKIRTLLEAQA
ncbi:MAG: histidine--tRNA ligase [Fibrobacterota bacterium]